MVATFSAHLMRLVGAVAISALINIAGFPAGAAAQSEAAAPPINDFFSIQLPGHWKLDALREEVMVDLGTRDEPLLKRRFSADISLREATYASSETDDGVTWLVALGAVGMERTVRGVATSMRSSGNWQTQIALEANPISSLGQPLAAFTGRVIVRGSPEEQEFRRERDELAQHAQAREAAYQAEKEQARRAIELAQADEARKQELLAYEHSLKINEAQAKYIDEVVRKQVELDLPGFFRLDSFKLGAALAATPNSAGEQTVEQEFEAVVSLRVDTFSSGEHVEEVGFLVPIAKAGETRTIYGKVKAKFVDGPGSLALEYESSVLDKLGKPMDAYPGRIVVDEGEEGARMREAITKRASERAATATRLLEATQKVELAKLDYQVKLEEAKAQAARNDLIRQNRLDSERREADVGQLQELAKNLASTDIPRRRQALAAALSDSDPRKQHLGLRSILEVGKSLTGSLISNNKEPIGFQVIVTSFDAGSGRFDCKISAGSSAGECSGRVQGPSITVQGPALKTAGNQAAYSAQFTAKLGAGSVLDGRAQGGVYVNSNWHALSAVSIVL